MMALPTGYFPMGLHSENGSQARAKATREEINLKRKMFHYEKDFNIHVSRISSNERSLRSSMRAYSDKMTEISARNTRGMNTLGIHESREDPDDMNLLVHAKHIPKHKPLTKLKGEKERLDLLRDHLSRSYDAMSDRGSTTSNRENDDHLRRSLPNMKLNTTQTQKQKESYGMKFVSASDLFDGIDNPRVNDGALIRKGNSHLAPLDRRSTLANPKDIVVDPSKKQMSLQGDDVRYTIIRKRTKSKKGKVKTDTDKEPSDLNVVKVNMFKLDDSIVRKRQPKDVEQKVQTIRVHEEQLESSHNKAQEYDRLTIVEPDDPPAQQIKASVDVETKTKPKEKARFSPDEFDKQLRAAITRSKKAKRMKMRAPNLGAIPENVSQSGEDDEDPDEAMEDHRISPNDIHRKIPRRSSPGDSSSISLRPMLAAIPELTSPDGGKRMREPQSLSAIKILRKTGSKEELMKHQQENARKIAMSTQQLDGQELLSGSKVKKSAKGRARRQMRAESNKKLKIRFMKDLSS